MLDMLRGTLVSEAIRGGLRSVGLVGAKGEVDSSGEVGGEGESSGDSGASSAMVIAVKRSKQLPEKASCH